MHCFQISLPVRATLLLLMAVLAGCTPKNPPVSQNPPQPSKPIAAAPKRPSPEVKGRPHIYETAEIRKIDQTVGPEDWADETRIRLTGAEWTFKPDGSFTFAPRMSREDIFPVSGRYSRKGSVYAFEAAKSAAGTGRDHSHAQVEGTLDYSDTAPLLTMRVETRIGTGLSEGDGSVALVNHGVYEATIEVRRLE
jgi:hypothetical protein